MINFFPDLFDNFNLVIEHLSPSVKYIGVVNFCKPIGRPKSGAREEDRNCFHANLPSKKKTLSCHIMIIVISYDDHHVITSS